jgi:HEAT repeat protein
LEFVVNLKANGKVPLSLPNPMSNFLESAQQAASVRDWASVNDRIAKALSSPSELPAAALLSLALQVIEFGDFQERWDVAKLIPKLGEIAIPPLLEMLADEEADVELRWFAGTILADSQQPQVIASLVDIINSSPEAELTEMAIATLGKIGNPAIEAISKLLTPPQTRLLAVRTLSQIRLAQTINPLLSVVQDPQVEIRSAAIAALSSFHDERIPPILIESLADAASAVRKEAVTALGLRQDLVLKLDLVPYFSPLLADPDLEVCIASAIALGRMGTDEAAIALFEKLRTGDVPLELQLALTRAIGWIETATAWRYLQQLLDCVPLPLSQEIVNRLGNVTTPSLRSLSAEILQAFLVSESPSAKDSQLKQSIATALGELGQTQSIESLIQLLADPDAGVKLHAIAGLKHLSPDLAHQTLQEMATKPNLNPALRAGIEMALQEWHL